MRKIVAGMNMTFDGFCDHTTSVAADDMSEFHEYYSDQLRNAGLLLYGRTTYQLMEDYWPMVARNPTGNKSTDEFGVVMDSIPKIVYSRTLKGVEWKGTTLKKEIVKDEILELKQQPGKDVFVGSPSVIVQLANLGIIDEYRICVLPILAAGGLSLFKDLKSRIDLKLVKTKTFKSGVVAFYYEPKASGV